MRFSGWSVSYSTDLISDRISKIVSSVPLMCFDPVFHEVNILRCLQQHYICRQYTYFPRKLTDPGFRMKPASSPADIPPTSVWKYIWVKRSKLGSPS